MNKNLLVLGGIASVILTIILGLNLRKSKKTALTVGIVQTISHPALDAARNSAIARLKELLKNEVSVVVQNAEGSILTAQNIATSYHNNSRIDAIITIGTLATQAVANIEKAKPIIYCAVTDPKSLGLVHNKTNACGMTDAAETKSAISLIKSLMPSIKNVAILYNQSEPNSASAVQEIDQSISESSLNSIHISVNNEAEINAATNIAVQKADLVVVPTDNTVACVLQSVAKICLKNKKPLLVCYDTELYPGILAYVGGVNYSMSGSLAGEISVKLLKKLQKPSDILVVKPDTQKIIMSKNAIEMLGIKISENLKNTVEIKD